LADLTREREMSQGGDFNFHLSRPFQNLVSIKTTDWSQRRENFVR